VAPGTEITLEGPIPVPFPVSHSTLCRLAVKGESLGDDVICPGCRASGRLVFTGSRVARNIIWYGKDGKLVYEEIKVPLACCRNCPGRFRVLPVEIAPRKTFSLPIIEDACRAYVQPDPDGPGLRKAVEGLAGISPNYTTLYRWMEGLGERVLDRLQTGGKKASFPEPWLSTAALISESAKRLNPDIQKRWNRSPKIPSWKYHSSRRRDQLQACARLLDCASFLFPDEPHPLTAWQGKIIEYFHVAGWWFPTGYPCTAIQLSPGRPDGLRYPATLKRRKKEANHGPRSPPDGLFSV